MQQYLTAGFYLQKVPLPSNNIYLALEVKSILLE